MRWMSRENVKLASVGVYLALLLGHVVGAVSADVLDQATRILLVILAANAYKSDRELRAIVSELKGG